MFYEACVEAGPDACALHETTVGAVESRVENIFAKLKAQPIPVYAPAASKSTSSVNYGLTDYAVARNIVFQFLYGPYGGGGYNATAVANGLAAAEKGDGRPLWDLKKETLTDFKRECGKDEPRTELYGGKETTLAIACSDGDIVDDSVDELQMHYEEMAKQSSFAEFWNWRVQCAYVSCSMLPRSSPYVSRQWMEDPCEGALPRSFRRQHFVPDLADWEQSRPSDAPVEVSSFHPAYV
jgi:hypothetical protein